MLNIGNYLIILAVALVAVIITVAIFRNDPIFTTLQFALVLTVAAIPAAMPTVFADKSIDEFLEGLNGTFHRLRQSGVDEELFDIITGFEALSVEEK